VNFPKSVLNDDLSRVSEAEARKAHISQVIRCVRSQGLDREGFRWWLPNPVVRAAGDVLTRMPIARVIESECADPSRLLNRAFSFEVEASEPLDIDHDGDQPSGVACNASRDRAQPSGRDGTKQRVLPLRVVG